MADINNELKHKETPPSIKDYPPQHQEDEIDLLDIWCVLVRQRKWIIAITLIVSLIAVVYVLVSPKVYIAEAIILPPVPRDIAELNIPGLYKTTADKVFKEMVQNLMSRSLQRQFFNNHKQIIGTLTVSNKKDGSSGGVSVTRESSDPEMLSEGLNNFIAFVNDYTIQSIFDFLDIAIKKEKTAIKSKIENLRDIEELKRKDQVAQLTENNIIARNILVDKIDAFKKQAKLRKEDRIAILEENLIIAKNLGIKEYSIFKSTTENGEGVTAIEKIHADHIPVYLRGERALRYEIEALRNRKSDDPFVNELRPLERELYILKKAREIEVLLNRKNNDSFIPDLRDFQVRLVELQAINLNTAHHMQATSVDLPAVAPKKPIKPKLMRIIVLGVMLGLILGIFTAFLVNFIYQRYCMKLNGWQRDGEKGN